MYTKGNWKVTHDTINDHIEGRDGEGRLLPIACTYSGKVGRNEAKQNALLIAAAPSMYEALQDMVKKYERERGLTHINDLHPEYSKAIAALKRAQGK